MWIVHEPRRVDCIDPHRRPTEDIEDALEVVRGRLGTAAGWKIVSMVPLVSDRSGGYIIVAERDFVL